MISLQLSIILDEGSSFIQHRLPVFKDLCVVVTNLLGNSFP